MGLSVKLLVLVSLVLSLVMLTADIGAVFTEADTESITEADKGTYRIALRTLQVPPTFQV